MSSQPAYPPLISHLLDSEAYPHPVESVRVLETHISWVLLTGNFAYKIKKPVHLEFLDFSSLQSRRYFCDEELRLNRRFIDNLYLKVVPIVAEGERLVVGGEGEPIEFAVQMRQFEQRNLASQMLTDKKLTQSKIQEFAVNLADLHKAAPSVFMDEDVFAKQLQEPVLGNFRELQKVLGESEFTENLSSLKAWSSTTGILRSEKFKTRHSQGFIRECHGDLHLGNIVSWQGVLTPFDCIEFNESFRNIDVMNEIAFLIMDLEDLGRVDLSRSFLNTYLELTGDYSGLSILPYYLVYRSLVRAKVDAIRLNQKNLSVQDQNTLTRQLRSYLDLALRYTQPSPPILTITNGFSGSGKTTGTESLILQRGAIRVRSDVERKRIFGLKSTERASTAPGNGIYSKGANQQTEARLLEMTQAGIEAGFSMVVDATFLKRSQREKFRQLAAEFGVPFRILQFETDKQTLRKRIRQRQQEGLDASDATLEVLEHQLRTYEPLTGNELQYVVPVTT